MKKIIISLIVILMTVTLSAQKETVEISTAKVKMINMIYEASITPEDTSYYMYIRFQNAKYTQITDFRYIWFSFPQDASNLQDFIADLENAYALIGSKKEVSWNGPNYRITLQKQGYVYIWADDRAGIAGYSPWLMKKQILKIVNHLKTIPLKG